MRMSAWIIGVLVGVSIVLTVAGQVLFKMGMTGVSFEGMTPFAIGQTVFLRLFHHWILLGILSFALGTIAWLMVLTRMDISVAYPLGSLGYVLTFAVGIIALHEPFSVERLIGVLLIMSGVIFILRPVG